MNKFTIFSAVVAAACLSQSASAQHTDVEFGFDDLANPTSIILENDDVSSEGIQFWEGEFVVFDPFVPGDFATDDPGFATAIGEGLQLNAGDNVFVRTLNAATDPRTTLGVGYVNYFNPTTQLLEAANRIAVTDESVGTVDLILDGATATGDDLQFVGTFDGTNDLDEHVVFDLLDDATAPDGAYGLLLEIEVQQANGSPAIVSDPLWVVFNHNLSEEVFEGAALGAFGIVESEAIPEPTALAFLFGGAACLAVRRRR